MWTIDIPRCRTSYAPFHSILLQGAASRGAAVKIKKKKRRLTSQRQSYVAPTSLSRTPFCIMVAGRKQHFVHVLNPNRARDRYFVVGFDCFCRDRPKLAGLEQPRPSGILLILRGRDLGAPVNSLRE